MMLHRSTSSRQRRASRSVTKTTQQQQQQEKEEGKKEEQQQQEEQQQEQQQQEEQEQEEQKEEEEEQQQQKQQQLIQSGVNEGQPQERRVSLAFSETISEVLTAGQIAFLTGVSSMDRQRSPRASCVPNIALDIDDENEAEIFNRRILPDPEYYSNSRLCLVADVNRSLRHSLVPAEYIANRSFCSSIVPDSNCSPRNSLIPDFNHSPQESLIPNVLRSSRHSLVPESSLSPRNSLVPLDIVGYNRSPRASLVSGASRISLIPEKGISKNPRHSSVQDSSKCPRGSVMNIEFDRNPKGSNRSRRGSIISECINQSPRGSIMPEMSNCSPRSSIVASLPRGSICSDESNRTPRDSIASHGPPSNRSPWSSIGLGDVDRSSHRDSVAVLNNEDECTSRSPRGSIGPISEFERSPRGSLGGFGQKRRLPRTGFTVQKYRRSSTDQGSLKNRSASPYRQRGNISGRIRSGGNGETHVILGYGTTNSWVDFRRASSSISQFSGDESRRLCGANTNIAEKDNAVSGGQKGVAAYGSLIFQLKDAHLEASGTCDFVFRGLRVVSKTMFVTIFLAFLSMMPIVMLILGVQYIKDCPREPHIPVYMVVGGTLGGVRMFWSLYSQIRSKRPEVLTVSESRPHISPKNLASIALSCFLVGWFILGNYWILGIRWPDYNPTLFEPNLWCHKTLYIFSLVHLCIIYFAVSAGVLACISLLFCRIIGCPWSERYK